jgi:hypothetical protein
MALLRGAVIGLAVLLGGCTFNPEYEVSKIVCTVGDDNTCPSTFICVRTEASPEGLCCKGTNGACTEEPPALAARGGGTGGDSFSGDSGVGTNAAGGVDGGMDVRTGGTDAAGGGGGIGAPDAGTGGSSGTGGGSGTGGSSGGTGGAGGAPSDGGPSPDAAADAMSDAAIDLATNPMCVPACNLGSKRCGSAGKLRQCVLIDGCPAWGAEMSCGSDGRRACTGAEPAAHCACPAGPSGCNDQAGAFCASTTALETCLADADGCIYKGPTTTCPAAKPCTGSLPAASCSCGAAPAACMGASGNLCTGSTTLITCGSNPEGCPAITAMKTCGASETCQGPAGSATCVCNTPPPACVGVGTGTVCSSNSVVSCGTTAGGCVTSSTVKSCTAGKPCSLVNGAADCRCGAADPTCAGVTGTVCSGNTVLSCGTNSDGCTTSSTAKTCPAGKPCAGAAGSADCTCGPVASECAGMTGAVCQGTTTVLSCGMNADGCGTSSTLETCSANKQCSGSPASCKCVNEPNLTDCPAGMDGSRCVGTQVYTCSTTSDGCRKLVKTNCPVNGACIGTLPAAMCVSEQTFGNATDLMGMDQAHQANTYWGFKIQVTSKIWLKRFGLIARNAPGHLRLVLYNDNGMGGMNSAPTTYIAGAFDYSVVTGKQEYAVNNVQGAPGNTPVILDPGQYWMLAVFEASTSIAHGSGSQFNRYKQLLAPTAWNSTPQTPITMTVVDDSTPAANYYLVGLPQ